MRFRIRAFIFCLSHFSVPASLRNVFDLWFALHWVLSSRALPRRRLDISTLCARRQIRRRDVPLCFTVYIFLPSEVSQQYDIIVGWHILRLQQTETWITFVAFKFRDFKLLCMVSWRNIRFASLTLLQLVVGSSCGSRTTSDMKLLRLFE